MKRYIKPESASLSFMTEGVVAGSTIEVNSASTTDDNFTRRRSGWDSSNWSNKEELTEE